MSVLALPRGSQATGFPEPSAQSPDPTMARAGRVLGVRTTAPPNPEHVKQKSSTIMTTTTSPPMENVTVSSDEKTVPTTVPRVDTTLRTATRISRQSRWSALLAFLEDDQRDLTAQQCEALLRLHLR